VKTSEFDYHLPPELIAQTPIEPRDAARLLQLDRFSGAIGHFHVAVIQNGPKYRRLSNFGTCCIRIIGFGRINRC